jgi:hypothetical protein
LACLADFVSELTMDMLRAAEEATPPLMQHPAHSVPAAVSSREDDYFNTKMSTSVTA